MASLFSNPHFRRGMRHGLPFMLVVVPFSMLFGVTGTEAGLTAVQTIAFSFLVIAGASQFAAVAQMTDAVPIAVVVLTALAVNMRMAMYSAALAPHLRGLGLSRRLFLAYALVDQSYMLSALEYDRRTDMTVTDRYIYFMGTFLPIGALWYAGSVIGAYVGAAIPEGFALDFVMPLTFLGLVAPAIRTWAHAAAALTSILLALALRDVPYGMGLILAALAAIAVGAVVETRLEPRQ